MIRSVNIFEENHGDTMFIRLEFWANDIQVHYVLTETVGERELQMINRFMKGGVV